MTRPGAALARRFEAKLRYPDTIVWSIQLRDTDKSLKEVTKRNDERVRAVVALQEKLGLKPGDLTTGSLCVRREYERTPQGDQGEFKHFAVSRSITIRQTDLKRFDELLDSLLSSTDMEVSSYSESSQAIATRAQTRLRAVQAAKEKASAMAEGLDAKLGRVLTIDEHSPSPSWSTAWPNYSSNAYAIRDAAPRTDVATERFVPGAIKEVVTVYVTFELR